MKKVVLGVILVLFLATSSWAVPLNGNITANSDPYFTGNGTWSGATLIWKVELNEQTGLWTYQYDFHTNTTVGAISHLMLELTPDIQTNARYYQITTQWEDIEHKFHGPGNNNPGLTTGFYGVKFDEIEDVFRFSFEIVTSRNPMLGDFYAKNGQAYGYWNWAWAQNIVAVPNAKDSVPVPEPSVSLLLGGIFLGLGYIGRKRMIK